MKTLQRLGLFMAIVAITACSTAPPAHDATTIRQAPAPGQGTCAFGVQGASASVQEREGGTALTVVTLSDPSDLRVRMRSAAEMRGPGSRQGQGHDGTHATGGQHGLQAMQLPPVRTTVEDVGQGARVLLTAVDAADIPRLREAMRDRVRVMNSGCD